MVVSFRVFLFLVVISNLSLESSIILTIIKIIIIHNFASRGRTKRGADRRLCESFPLIGLRPNTHTHTNIYPFPPTYPHTHTQTPPHTHTHTHTNTHSPSLSLSKTWLLCGEKQPRREEEGSSCANQYIYKSHPIVFLHPT